MYHIIVVYQAENMNVNTFKLKLQLYIYHEWKDICMQTISVQLTHLA